MKSFPASLIIANALSVLALSAQEAAPASPPVPVAEPPPASFAALIKNSPFKPIAKTGSRGGVHVQANAQWRFLGMLTIDGKTEFGVYDSVAQKSYWLKLRERNATGIIAEHFDDAQKSLTLQTANGRQILSLATPDEKPLAITGSVSYTPVATPPQQQNSNNNRRPNPQQRPPQQGRRGSARPR